MSADLVIRNGMVVDGTGAPARRADIAIEGERIVAVGDDISTGRRELDADGLLVTPGFVDPHTHYDGQATWDPLLAPSSHHGVTTVAMGNCGVGFAPVAPDRHDWLIAMMEGVEDIPGTALHEGLRWDWESFPEYLDALERQPRTIDVGTHLPHAALRAFVMGERGADPMEHPDEPELVEMARLLEQGLEAGAIGVSTSRTERHRTSTGENLGTLRAREPELLTLASVLRSTGKGVFQFLSDSYRTTNDAFAQSEFALITEFARASQRPVSYTVQQDLEAPDRWRDLMTLAATLQAEGLDVKAQVAPRPIGVLLGLEASANVFTPARAYGRVAGLPLAERIVALQDPERRQKILEGHATLTSGADAFAGFSFFGRFDDMYVLEDPPNYDLDRSQSLGATARRLGIDPREYAYDVQLNRGGRQLIYTPLFNFVAGNLDVVHEMISSPVAMFGLSDAGAHCGQICDGSMTTSFMTLWARDRMDRDGLPIESVVHQMTQRPASHFGWLDRGVVAPGLLADLNVIDLENLECSSPEIATDLPAGGRRLLQASKGYKWTIKRGSVTFEDDAPTGQLPGTLIPAVRRPARAEIKDLNMPDVLQGIIAQARTDPDHPAVKDLGTELSYAQLCEAAARLSAGLAAHGVVEGDRVALLLPNSVDFVVAAVASLWIGAIFVPLSVGDPEARLASIVADCTPAIVIRADEVREDGPPSGASLGQAPLVPISTLRQGREGEELPPPVSASPRVAYAIYTSGTTGAPKGVLIGSAAFGAAVEATSAALGLDRATRTLCVSPFHFDGSFGTLFPTLFSGGAVVIRPREALLFPRTFFNAVAKEGITYTGFSPSYLRLLLASPQMAKLSESHLDVIALGGEASSIADIRAVWSSAPTVRVFNRYGPTETTIAVTHILLTPELTADDTVPLGHPHPGVSFYLVDESGSLVEGPDQVGELYIGGNQLMEGYWGAPALTEGVLRSDVVPGEVVYRTGDLVYRDESGSYVYVDRADRVIKRSGVRISLIELSEVMRSLTGVAAAACVTFDDEGELGIAAFVVTETGVSVSELREAARERLPETMLPNRFEIVSELPMTKSSKLDERLLLSESGLHPFGSNTAEASPT